VGPFASKYKTITINAKPYNLNTLGCNDEGGGDNFSKADSCQVDDRNVYSPGFLPHGWDLRNAGTFPQDFL